MTCPRVTTRTPRVPKRPPYTHQLVGTWTPLAYAHEVTYGSASWVADLGRDRLALERKANELNAGNHNNLYYYVRYYVEPTGTDR